MVTLVLRGHHRDMVTLFPTGTHLEPVTLVLTLASSVPVTLAPTVPHLELVTLILSSMPRMHLSTSCVLMAMRM